MMRDLVRELFHDPRILGGRRVDIARQGLSPLDEVGDKDCGVRVSGGAVDHAVNVVARYNKMPAWRRGHWQ